LLAALTERFAGAAANCQDGLRLDWPDERAWLLVRPSNTEPLVRAIAEAPTRQNCEQLCAAAKEVAAAI
jgi:phosphomannomutase